MHSLYLNGLLGILDDVVRIRVGVFGTWDSLFSISEYSIYFFVINLTPRPVVALGRNTRYEFQMYYKGRRQILLYGFCP